MIANGQRRTAHGISYLSKTRNNIISIILFLISLTVSAQSELDNYLQTAAENNPGLKAKFNDYMATLEKVPQVVALPDPTVAFGYFIQPVSWSIRLRLGRKHLS